MFDWISLDDVYNNLLATLIWVLFAGTIGLIFTTRIASLVRRLLPQIDSSIPHVDFSMKYNEQSDYKSDVTISNNGGEPAYNIYVFLYNKSYINDNDYSLKSLGGENIRSGVLRASGSVHFKGVDVTFDSCNINTRQEIWIEYDNSAGVHFRTVVTPPTPRGDGMKVHPPKVISKRLEMLPGFNKIFTDNRWKRYEKGGRNLFPRKNLISRIVNSMMRN